MKRSRRSLLERWEEKVDRSGGPDACWLWTSVVSRDGYGRIWSEGRMPGAHRVAWELFRGPIPKGGGQHRTCVLHRCDVPICVNPGHLFLGTDADNVADMTAKGRGVAPGVRGERNGASKLTEAQVAEIRRRRASGELGRTIATDFGISPQQVSNLANGKSWQPRALLGGGKP